MSVLVFLWTVLLVTGCSSNGTEPGHLDGVWINVFRMQGEPDFITEIRIDAEAQTILYVDSYEGTIVNSPDWTAAHGVLIIEFTRYNDFMEPPPRSDHPNVGKFGALYWRDLSRGSVFMADAYIGFDPALFDTIQEAQTNFTLHNVETFIPWGITGLYTK